MPIQKQNVNISFGQGLDTKTDPFQIPIGKFFDLENSIFEKGLQLKKRNGNAQLPSLPDTTNKFLTTFNGNLTAIGTTLNALSSSSSSWINKGNIIPVSLNTLSLIKNTNNQSQCDSAVSNGLVCTVYTEGSNYKYVVADVATGQNIVAPTTISSPSESPRIFVLGSYFLILFSQSASLRYIAIPVNNVSSPTSATTIITNYSAGGTQLAFDGVVANSSLYISYNDGTNVRMTYLNSFLILQTVGTGIIVASSKTATMISICADTTGINAIIWVSFYKTAGTTGFSLAVDNQLTSVLAATQIVSAGTVLNITSAAKSAVLTVLLEFSNNYSFDSTIPSHFVSSLTVTQAGTVTSVNGTVLDRSVGLASKSFILNNSIYFMGVYQSSYQPTYFLMNSSGNVITKLAYENGGGYLTLGLPEVTVSSTIAYVPYLIKDLITPVNKNTNVSSGIQINGIYAQTGISLASFNFTTTLNTAELGSNLNISGGFVWAYDGFVPVEQNFFLYPDLDLNTDGTYHGLTSATSGGHLSDSTKFYYVATYEWSDNQGNLFRSAPSVPVTITTGASGTNVNTNTIKIPTLRLTYKTTNKVKICVYRWSTNQQTYYQVTSVSAPTANDTTADIVTITDTFSDATILGNSVLYTTGGVVENIGPPATDLFTLFKSRLFLVDSEDRNLLWYSKQVIESTPVEMSDLFTIYVAPTIGAQGNTGPITALSSMDDKLIIFKRNAINYLTGTGPDNTGANNDFSDVVFITTTVGCANQNSIVFMPQGLMFQSPNKGVWLLGRDLSTSYIGAPVEAYNSYTVLAAVNVPSTNQVRLTLSNGITLMYDYFYGQWGTFTNVPAISSTIYQNLHTYIDSYGNAFQENPGSYLDGSKPTLMKFTTGWINLSGLQGYQRAYFFYLLGIFLSPHKLNIQIAYDYNSSPTQSLTISPGNYGGTYGDDTILGGGTPLGGPGNIERWRVFFIIQKCEAFQLTIGEIFDPSFGTVAGPGLTLSGINLVYGGKSVYPRLSAAKSIG